MIKNIGLLQSPVVSYLQAIRVLCRALQRKLRSSNHAKRQMTEMTYLLERTIHEYIAYETDCKKNHLLLERYKLQSKFLMEYKHFEIIS